VTGQAIADLRREGFVRIDVQTKSAATASVWYRKGDPLLHPGGRRPEVVMPVQEGRDARAAPVLAWRL